MNRAELAAVLRQARARLRPQDVGLPSGTRRQVPGLRREEVAMLAGLSVDYVVRLEQGRGARPSAQVITALAQALRLDDDDRDLLFRLAGHEPPQPGRMGMAVRPSVLRLLDRMADLPVLVLSAKGDVLAWNPLAAALQGDMSAWPRHRRNLIWQRFLGSSRCQVAADPGEDEAAARAAVGTLRAAQARYPRDSDLARMISELRRGSPRFEELWRQGRSAAWRTATKSIRHPQIGTITLDCDTLLLPDTDQTVLVYSAAPGSPEATALDVLRVTGLQRL
ncbi:helix-turn-helix domain-containing protein [Nonomuraea jiangxiensis]|uniref:Helix-turn-helix domain-containing protein n=1 Tax=Nonomuraea jiangxiensis TaxID=633440 RepID=A0A1G9N7E2_9ACTN|nr:helix-turn-helix transcriptional regulator [Nonomuraea jiangxiensis]SDL82283.1 Helix-turn-helix domain-containing protein [Nonomuraea jiangxiensis]